MRLKHGGTFVKCTACQGEDFYPAFPVTKDRRDVMICARCENQAVFGELIGKPSASALSAKMPWATAPAPALQPARRGAHAAVKALRQVKSPGAGSHEEMQRNE